MSTPYELREMGFAEILDHGLKLFKSNFIPLVLMVALFFGPSKFAMSIAFAYLFHGTGNTLIGSFIDGLTGGDPDAVQEDYPFDGDEPIYSIIARVLSFVLLILAPLAFLGVIKALSEDIRGKPVSISRCLRFALTRFWTLIAVLLLALIFTYLYLVCLVAFPTFCVTGLMYEDTGILSAIFLIGYMVIAALLLARAFTFVSFLPVVIAMERVGVIRAFTRTWELLSGYILRSMGIFIVCFIFVRVIIWIFSSMGQLIGVLIPGAYGIAFMATVSTLFEAIFQPIIWTILFLIYIDLRIRKENFDLEIMMQRTLTTADEKPIPVPENENDVWE